MDKKYVSFRIEKESLTGAQMKLITTSEYTPLSMSEGRTKIILLCLLMMYFLITVPHWNIQRYKKTE